MNRPHPYTFGTKHLTALNDAAARLMATSPTPQKIHDFAASLPKQVPQIESAVYNPELRRIEVRGVGGAIAFPVPLPDPPAPKPAEPAKPSITKIEADIARDGGEAHVNADGSLTATYPAHAGG